MRCFKKLRVISFLVLITFTFSLLQPLPLHASDGGGWNLGGQGVGGTGTGGPPPGGEGPPPPPKPCSGGDPVYLHSGNFWYECVDLMIPGRGMNVEISHHYSSGQDINGQFGYGWTIDYYERLQILSTGNVQIVKGNSRSDEYQSLGAGRYQSPAGFFEDLVQNANGTWTLTDTPGTKHNYDVNGNLTSIVDRNGNTIAFTYDAQGLLPVVGASAFSQTPGQKMIIALDYRLTKITDTVGRDINFTYNADGRLDKITDYAGREVKFVYDSQTDDLLSITRPSTPQYSNGLTKAFSYTNHNMETLTDEKGQQFTKNYYDSQERVYKQDYGSGTWNFSYDTTNKVTTVTDRKGFIKKYTFNSTGNLVKLEEFTAGLHSNEPASYVTQYSYNPTMGMTSEAYPAGNGIKYTYDEGNSSRRSQGNLLEVRRKADMSLPDNNTNDLVTTYTYESNFNQIKTKTDPKGNVTTFTIDPTNGNVTAIDYPRVNGQIPRVSYTFNSHGQVLSMTDANNNVTQYAYYETTTGYLQNVTEDPSPGINAATQYTYDLYGNLDKVTDAQNHMTDSDYNELGWLIEVTNPLLYKTKYSYDQNGNITRIQRQADASATTWQAISYTHTILNKVKTITDPLTRVTMYNYDLNENLSSMVDAENKTTTYIYDERDLLFKTIEANNGVTEQTYDLNKNLKEIKDANGNLTKYIHDGFDRQQRMTYADNTFSQYDYDKNSNLTRHTTPGTKVMEYDYDELDRRTGRRFLSTPSLNTIYGYDLGSRLKLIQNSVSRIDHIYDAMNRIITTTETYGTNVYTIGNQYDKVSNRTKITYPSGKVVDYIYDNNNRLQDVKINNVLKFHYIYDPLNRTQQRDAYTVSTQQTFYTFDIANQLSQIKHEKLGVPTPFAQFDYTYDNVRNRKTTTIASGADTYGYNNIYELTSVIGLQTHSYQYDNVANRLNADGMVYVPNNVNQYGQVGGVTFSYDGNGNLTSDGINTYSYDEINRLTSVPNVQAGYEYDGLDRRISKTVGATKTYFVLDGDHEIEERNASGVLLAEYVYGDDIDEILTMDRGGQTSYYFMDGLGSITNMSNAAGNVVESYSYDVYGTPNRSSSIGNPYFFASRRFDSESGMYYYRARIYSPRIGRFLQRDLLGYLDSMNLYGYLKNNPLRYIDPYGLYSFDDFLQDAANFSAGAGDLLSFGLTNKVRDWMGTNDVVDKCSGLYKAGEWTGLGLSAATGLAGGIKAAGKAAAGKEFSHWIPTRMGGPRSIWNGNYVSPARHYKHDPFRYPQGWRDLGPKWSQPVQQFDRIPNAYKGAAAGAGYGGASMANNGCKCQ